MQLETSYMRVERRRTSERYHACQSRKADRKEHRVYKALLHRNPTEPFETIERHGAEIMYMTKLLSHMDRKRVKTIHHRRVKYASSLVNEPDDFSLAADENTKPLCFISILSGDTARFSVPMSYVWPIVS